MAISTHQPLTHTHPLHTTSHPFHTATSFTLDLRMDMCVSIAPRIINPKCPSKLRPMYVNHSDSTHCGIKKKKKKKLHITILVCVSFPMIFVRGYVLCLLIYSICYHIFHQPLFEASSIKILLEHTINVTYPCPHTPTPLPSLTLCYHQTHPHPHTHPHPYPLSHHVTTKLTITTRYVPSQDCVSAPRWAVL